jgi:hypothetical protein
MIVMQKIDCLTEELYDALKNRRATVPAKTVARPFENTETRP